MCQTSQRASCARNTHAHTALLQFEALDDALRTKDQASALKSLQATKGALDVVIASVQ